MADASANALVQPQLRELIAMRARVQAWPPPLRGSAGLAGVAPSPFRGRGMEFAETRLYASGDDVRHMDWRVTARTGKAHTKLFHPERERVALLIADTSPGLYFGTRGCFKSVQAARVAALVAWAAQRSGDRIGILRGSHRESPVAPASGVRGVLRVLDAAARWYAHPPADDAGLADAFVAAARLLRPGARVVALIEPHTLATLSDAALAGMAGHHELLIVMLTDPIETEPPRATLPIVANGQRARIDLAHGRERARWQQRFADELQAGRARLQRFGIRSHVLATTEAVESLLPLLLAGGRRS